MDQEQYRCPRCMGSIGANDAMCPWCGCSIALKDGNIEPTGHVCFACGRQNEMLGDSCPECLQRYQVTCMHCGATFPIGMMRCPHCNNEQRNGKAPEQRSSELRPPRPGLGSKLVGDILVKSVALLLAFGASLFLIDLATNYGGSIGGSAAVLVLVVAGVVIGWRVFKQNANIEEPSHDTADMVEVFRTYNVAEAEILRAAMEEGGLEAVLVNQYANSVLPIPAIGGIQIVVPVQQENEAHQVIAAFTDNGPKRRD